eukprot:65225-Amorphochlora_amoeboformis.AAC.2
MGVNKQILGASIALNAILAITVVMMCVRGGAQLGVGVASSVGTRNGIATFPPNAYMSMKLVAAAKVRRAQAAVLGGRPFAENLVKTLYGVNQKVRSDDLDSPLTEIRPVKNVLLLSIGGDRGLCGAYNTFLLKKVLQRTKELEGMGIGVKHMAVGRKMASWLKRRADEYELLNGVEMKSLLNPKAAADEQADALSSFAEEVLTSFVDGEVDKVEIVYTKFKSLIGSDPIIQTLLPLTPKGEICDTNGVCVDADEDEIFKLTTK